MRKRLGALTAAAVLLATAQGCSSGGESPSGATSPPQTSSHPSAQSGGAASKCDAALRRIANRLSSSWSHVERNRTDDELLATAIRSFDAIYRASASALRSVGCDSPGDFTTFQDALARVNPQSPLLNAELLDVARALARLGGQPSAGIHLPAAPASVKPSTSTTPTSLAIGQTAHLPYFDVTVSDVRTAPYGVSGVRVTVCYTHPHPDAQTDGSTRLSRDPWTFDVKRSDGSVSQLAPQWIEMSEPFIPVYGDAHVRVGECRSGWITTIPSQGDVLTMANYAPSDFDFSARWVLQ